MTWWAVHVSPDAVHCPGLAAWLVSESNQSVQERDDGVLIASLPTRAEARQLAGRLESVHALNGELHAIPDVDWTLRWRDGIVAHDIGRVRITPSWLADQPSPLVQVVIDPESAFGSGEHGSTRGAICLLDRHLRRGHTVLDLGSGSGVVSIAATRLGAAWAVGIECDGECIPIAEQNAKRNGVSAAVTWIEGDAAVLTPLFAPVDRIVSNILRIVNAALLPEIRQSLAPDGVAIFAGMEAEEKPLFLRSLSTEGFAVIDEVIDSGWWAVAAEVAR